MRHWYLLSGVVIAGVLVLTGFAQAGGGGPSFGFCLDGPDKDQDCHFDDDCPHSGCTRVLTARHCKSGPRKGILCSTDNECPKSTCEIVFLYGPDTTFAAELTLIVNDNIINSRKTTRSLIPSPDQIVQKVTDIIGVTVLLEFSTEEKQKPLFSRTYQNLSNPQAGPCCFVYPRLGVVNATESQLSVSIASNLVMVQSILDQFADGIRELFGVVGKPLVVDILKNSIEYNDHEADDLASVLRFKIKVRFVRE